MAICRSQYDFGLNIEFKLLQRMETFQFKNSLRIYVAMIMCDVFILEGNRFINNFLILVYLIYFAFSVDPSS